MQIIGKCSICGGTVVKPTLPLQKVKYSTVPIAARCQKCGAVEDSLPVIKMRPKEQPARRDLLEFGGPQFMD